MLKIHKSSIFSSHTSLPWLFFRFSDFLSSCERSRVCTPTRTKVHKSKCVHTECIRCRSLHTSFNTYRCRALWFFKSQKTRMCTLIVKARVIIYVHKCSRRGRRAIEIAPAKRKGIGSIVYNNANGNALVLSGYFCLYVCSLRALNLDFAIYEM